MPKCNVCGCHWYREDEINPREPCPCDYCGDTGETVWSIDGWRSALTWLKWKCLRIRYWWWD